MNEKLRICILLDSFEVSAWQYTMIERIMNSSYASIELIVLNDGGSLYKSKIDKLIKNRDQVIYYLFNKLDQKMFSRNPDAFVKKDLTTLVSGVPVLKVKPIRKKFSDYFEPEDITKIRNHEIDIHLRLGFRVLKGYTLKSSKYGIWSFHHGDNQVNRGGPPGFWEVVKNWPTTGSILQILSEELDAGKVIYRSWSCTHKLSISKNKNRYYWKSLAFLPRKIEELHNIGEERFFEKINNDTNDIDLYTESLFKVPSNLPAVRLAAGQLYRILLHFLEGLIYLNQWIIMFDLKRDMSMSPWRFNKIIPPKDRFWADPHIIKQNDMYYIFVEEFLFNTNKGHISVIEIDKQGIYKKANKVLETDYHLSYPFVFEFGEKIYMIPDSHDNRTIELYECSEFPYKWKHKMNLMDDFDAVDTTLLHYNDMWWMFTAVKEYEGAARDELYIYYSNDFLTSSWAAHPLNPVISDVRRARPAGRIFKREGKIYRPSQDCSHHYGYGFHIHEVEVLTETDYSERVVTSARPDWEKNIISTHTFAYETGLTVIDALMRRPKL